MIQGVGEAEKAAEAVNSISKAEQGDSTHRFSDEIFSQDLKVKPRWATDSERLNRAKTALRLTMNQANKILETIKYFRSFHHKPCDIQDTGSSIYESVNQVLHAMSYEYPFNKITLVKIVPRDLPRLCIPREHLDTIFFQLVYQARRSIGENPGIITVEAKEEVYLSPGSVSVRYFEIRVGDTGGSIPDEMVRETGPETGGHDAGLGCYVVKRLVEINKGTFRAENHRRGNSYYIKFLSGQGGNT